jgi:hypothetical protein
VPTSTGSILNTRCGDKQNTFLQLGLAPHTIDPRLQLLHKYLENCQVTLNAIRTDFNVSQSNPENPTSLQQAAQRLAELCTDTDGWGFDMIYRVAFNLQVLLIDSLTRIHDDPFWKTLDKGLELLTILINQCEVDFHQRLVANDVLDSTS